MGILIITKLFVLSLLSGFQFAPKLTMRWKLGGLLTINYEVEVGGALTINYEVEVRGAPHH